MKVDDFMHDVAHGTIAAALDPIRDELDAAMIKDFHITHMTPEVLAAMMKFANRYLVEHYPNLRLSVTVRCSCGWRETVWFHCSAGYGLRQDPPSQFIFARMLSVFSAVFDRAQNSAMHRLHEAERTGQIKHFIFPYLGQQDRQLPNPPPDLVRREEAHAYPTDFNAMSDEWIDRLSLRGEQLTLCLARAYLPHLINKPSRAQGTRHAH